LKPFDKVLVRVDDDRLWVATLFSHIEMWEQQIPYNDKTAHLVGTTEIDWEQRRYEIAKDALAALLSNPTIGGVYASYSKVAVDYADALIKELKKK